MTKEQFFEEKILPYLENAISWKNVIFLADLPVDSLDEVGLIKSRKTEDRLIDSFIKCGEYQICFHRYLLFITKIKKGDTVLYEYTEEIASVKRPEVAFLEIF